MFVCCFSCVLSLCCSDLVVSTSAYDCMKRFVFEVTCNALMRNAKCYSVIHRD